MHKVLLIPQQLGIWALELHKSDFTYVTLSKFLKFCKSWSAHLQGGHTNGTSAVTLQKLNWVVPLQVQHGTQSNNLCCQDEDHCVIVKAFQHKYSRFFISSHFQITRFSQQRTESIQTQCDIVVDLYYVLKPIVLASLLKTVLTLYYSLGNTVQ